MRRFFEHPNHMFKLINNNYTIIKFLYLDLCFGTISKDFLNAYADVGARGLKFGLGLNLHPKLELARRRNCTCAY